MYFEPFFRLTTDRWCPMAQGFDLVLTGSISLNHAKVWQRKGHPTPIQVPKLVFVIQQGTIPSLPRTRNSMEVYRGP